MKITDRAVSRTFRDDLAGELPGLADNTAYWRMTQHLLFGTFRDLSTGNLMLPCGLIATIEDKIADTNYSAIKFIDGYRTAVLDFEVADYVFHPDPKQAKYRSVAALVLPEVVAQLVHDERRRTPEDRVWMSTGNTWLRKHLALLRQERLAKAQARPSDCPEVQMLLNYMNGLPPNRFTRALKYLPEAKAAAEECADADGQLNLLGAIQDSIQPLYAPTDKCTRIFAEGASLLGLHTSLRKIITQDWITADLKSAQLAIVARLWDIGPVNEYLRSGRSIWKDLCAHMGVALTDENKGVMKDALYGLLYGAGEEKLTTLLGQHFSVASQAFRKFTSHSVIASLLKTRLSQAAGIRRDGGAHDAFGNWTALEHISVKDRPYDYDNSRSIMACVSQSYELRLLLPIIEEAIAQRDQEHGFTICTWLHDGFTFDCKAADRAHWKRTLSRLVNERAEALGIHTELDF